MSKVSYKKTQILENSKSSRKGKFLSDSAKKFDFFDYTDDENDDDSKNDIQPN